MNSEATLVDTLSFQISGEFITKIAREWFWEEHKEYAKVEELLLSCMRGTEQSKQQLKENAFDVVFGRKKFEGNTAEGSFCLTSDDSMKIISRIEFLFEQISEKNDRLEETQEKYDALVDKIYEQGYEEELGLEEYESQEKESDMSPTLSSYFKQIKIEKEHKDNYGFLEPNGEFHPVSWGEHHQFAFDYLHDEKIHGEYVKQVGEDKEHDFFRAEDYLVYEKGWVLLHNPGLGVAKVTRDESKRLTKKQMEFLYNYYADRGLSEQAKEYLE